MSPFSPLARQCRPENGACPRYIAQTWLELAADCFSYEHLRNRSVFQADHLALHPFSTSSPTYSTNLWGRPLGAT
jgi:hypothetical protein